MGTSIQVFAGLLLVAAVVAGGLYFYTGRSGDPTAGFHQLTLKFGTAKEITPTVGTAPLLQSASDFGALPVEEVESTRPRTVRTIIDYSIGKDGVVSYAYYGDLVPEKVVPDEVPELRTEQSYSRFIKVVKDGTDPILKLTTVSYTSPTFIQDPTGVWRYVGIATTTKEYWQKRQVSLFQRIREFVLPTAWATVVDLYSGAGDGYVGEDLGGLTFGASRVLASGNSVSSTATIALVTSYRETAPTDSTIYRSFFPFDTSSIPSSATISAATLNLYVTAKNDAADDGTDYVTVSTSTTATHTSLSLSDYSQVTVTMNAASECIDSSERKDITAITTGAYLVFTFNAAGIAAIKLSGQSSTCSGTTGLTCISVREGHDATGTLPTAFAEDSVTFSTFEDGTNKPYLEITYTAPATAISTEPHITRGVYNSGGKIQVVGGGLKILR